jgi:hypothetical protein
MLIYIKVSTSSNLNYSTVSMNISTSFQPR